MVRRTGGFVLDCALACAAALLSASALRAQARPDTPPPAAAQAQPAPAERAPSPPELPLVEVPAAGKGDAVVVFVSGDGGWASIDRSVAGVLAGAGMPVVGLNSLKYFWTRRTPDEAGRDLERLVSWALASTGRRDVLLVGYSRGADVLPFMVSRLSEPLRQRVRLVALLGPATSVDFQFHLSDWWRNAHRRSDLPLRPELARIQGRVPLLCVYGEDDSDTVCPLLPAEGVEAVRVKGSHHFDGAYTELGQLVLRAAARVGS